MTDKLFEPFVTSKDPGQGTGLGLSLVYSIVQDHQGSVALHSTPGKGTRVVLRLPAAPESTAELVPASNAAVP